MRFIIPSVVVLLITIAVTAVEFECFYNTEDFPSYGFVYSCAIKIGEIKKKSDVEIKSMNGNHITDIDNDGVLGFLVFYKILHHFPQKVTHFFKNIKAVSVEYSKLKEIHKEDLRQFGDNLIDFGLEGNEIQTIEAELFSHNSNLKYISLINNKIQTIAENVFDNLNGLYGINLLNNNCINYVYYGQEIRGFIRSITLKCSDKFPSRDIRIPTIITEEDYNSYLVKLMRKKIIELEQKIEEVNNTNCRNM
ncbi:unnamed protein product [Chironomus riparius]|uniref:Uncharacterized protein n=1 Tax=Chironomus riparius TaxID=315576 RepID=A0A9P0IW27_9DIPT|nr:unnamed protein product [Chironomus riparius]